MYLNFLTAKQPYYVRIVSIHSVPTTYLQTFLFFARKFCNRQKRHGRKKLQLTIYLGVKILLNPWRYITVEQNSSNNSYTRWEAVEGIAAKS